jgi:hypothetical protein
MTRLCCKSLWKRRALPESNECHKRKDRGSSDITIHSSKCADQALNTRKRKEPIIIRDSPEAVLQSDVPRLRRAQELTRPNCHVQQDLLSSSESMCVCVLNRPTDVDDQIGRAGPNRAV